jgi:hypothetical protein
MPNGEIFLGMFADFILNYQPMHVRAKYCELVIIVVWWTLSFMLIGLMDGSA